MKLAQIGLLAVAAALVLITSAEALTRREQRARAAHRYGPPPSYERVCIKMCPQDSLPCDPIYFKVADGRCTYGFER